MIKRAQRIYGRVFTVSGVVAAFRRSALHSVGYWNLDMVTEDIDISWSCSKSGRQTSIDYALASITGRAQPGVLPR